ncbi:hypothetical protein ACFV4I_22555 [Nocardiopsis alba]|uniref:hypothetical protein n=1 Tax=Nocardiopsis alba TaxID=53437 RepID=UPI00365FEB53
MVHIVGVHGIGQGGTGHRQVAEDWEGAILDGIDEIGVVLEQDFSFSLAYWTDLLSPDVRHLGPEDDPIDDGVPMSEAEAAFVVDMFTDRLGEDTVERIEQAPDEELGPPAMSPLVNRLIAELDGWSKSEGRNEKRSVGGRLVRASREVYRYLFVPELARPVRDRVARNLAENTSIVVAHSLGSVIAYDLLRGDEIPSGWGIRKRTLITCGSPLGFPTVRRALGFEDGTILDPLPGVHWVNVYDEKDVVTAGRGLDQEPFVIDEKVDNGLRDPHSARKYLRSEPMARTILAADR